MEDCLHFSPASSLSTILFIYENLKNKHDRIDLGSFSHILSYVGRIDALIHLPLLRYRPFADSIVEANDLEGKNCITILKEQHSTRTLLSHLICLEFDYQRIDIQKIPLELISFISELALEEFYKSDEKMQFLRMCSDERIHQYQETRPTLLGYCIQNSLYDCCFYLITQRRVDVNQNSVSIFHISELEHPLTLALLYCSNHFKEKLVEILLLKGAQIDIILCKLLRICFAKKLFSIAWRLMHKCRDTLDRSEIKQLLCGKEFFIPLDLFSMVCCHLGLTFSNTECVI